MNLLQVRILINLACFDLHFRVSCAQQYALYSKMASDCLTQQHRLAVAQKLSMFFSIDTAIGCVPPKSGEVTVGRITDCPGPTKYDLHP